MIESDQTIRRGEVWLASDPGSVDIVPVGGPALLLNFVSLTGSQVDRLSQDAGQTAQAGRVGDGLTTTNVLQ